MATKDRSWNRARFLGNLHVQVETSISNEDFAVARPEVNEANKESFANHEANSCMQNDDWQNAFLIEFGMLVVIDNVIEPKSDPSKIEIQQAIKEGKTTIQVLGAFSIK